MFLTTTKNMRIKRRNENKMKMSYVEQNDFIRKVTFSNHVLIIMIPMSNEYKEAGLDTYMWTSSEEFQHNKKKLIKDVLTSKIYNARESFRTNLLQFDKNEEEEE
jgi:hypothetical protein